jgi:ATP-dependent Lon protease
LRGRVLPIGGLKEKILAAKRAKLTTVILPRRNKKDLEEIPKHLLKGIQLAFADTMDDVMKIALRRNVKASPVSRKPSPPPAPTRIRPLRSGKGRRSHELPATVMASQVPARS